MSIVVKFPGQTETLQLPDIPVAYPDGFPAGDWPDLSTLKYHTVFLSTLGGYHLAATEYPLGCISMGDDGDWLAQATSDDFIGISETANCVVLTCDDGDTAWVPRAAAGMTHDRPVTYEIINPNANPVLGATMLAWYAFGTTDGYLYLLWSDYDIKKTSDLDADTGAINSWETEPYHKSDVSKPPFILPDGTELPALPDGCFDGTPYGMVVPNHDAGSVSLVTANSPLIYFAEVPIGIENQPGIISVWDCIDGGWTPLANKMEIPAGAFGADLEGALWSNHDLLFATRNDDGSYTIGTEIARKSDENYRVTGGYMTSIANEARRLGGKTGGMLPAVTEETLRGVTQGIPSAEGVEF